MDLDDGADGDGNSGERAKVTVLIRWLAVFVAIPTITIGGVLYLTDPNAHFLHMAGFLVLGAVAVIVLFIAPKLAKRWVPETA